MPIDLHGKTALVTGGATGIGRAVALCLADAGADVAVTCHRHDGEHVARQIEQRGRRSTSVSLDAADSRQVNLAIETAVGALDRIDILVNNAGGLIARVDLADMTDEHWQRVIDVNLSSVFYFTRGVLPHMPDGGRIVTISSLAAQNGGGAGASAYAAAKAGIIGFSRAIAKELGPRGITVNVIAPGLILETLFHDTFTPKQAQRAAIDAIPLGRAGYPDDVAGGVLYLVSQLGAFCTGAVLNLNGGSYFT